MEHKSLGFEFKEIDGRKVTGIAAVTGNVDSGADVIHKGAFKKTLKEGTSRVRHLWMHDPMQPPTAKIIALEEVGKTGLPSEVRDRFPSATGGLLVTREYLSTPRGEEVYQAVTSGALAEMSIAFDSLKYDFEEGKDEWKGWMVRNIREIRLWDTSDVTWGMNPATVAMKAVVPFYPTGVASKDAEEFTAELKDFTDLEWSELTDAEKRRISAHFGWSVSNPVEQFEDLKFLHHLPGHDGIGKAVWANSFKAMLDLPLQAELSLDDMREVYSHLARHYSEFEESAPAYKLIELGRVVADARKLCAGGLAEFRLGRTVVEQELDAVVEALAQVSKVLTAAEPPTIEPETPLAAVNPVLTANVLERLAQARTKINP